MENLTSFSHTNLQLQTNAPELAQTQTMAATLHVNNSNANIAPKHSIIRPKWHTGIRSKSSPREILLEIYTGLQKLGIEWSSLKVPMRRTSLPYAGSHSMPSIHGDEEDPTDENGFDPYRIDARYLIPDSHQHESQWALYFEVMLYKLSDKTLNDPNRQGQRSYTRGGYLVDFCDRGIFRVQAGDNSSDTSKPSMMSSSVIFLDICAKILNELAINA